MGSNAMWSKAGRELARSRATPFLSMFIVHCRSHRAFHFRQAELLPCATFAFDTQVPTITRRATLMLLIRVS